MKETLKNPIVKSTVIIFLGFLLTSTGWLAWEYHLLTQISARAADVCTMVAGYSLQAVGVGIFAYILRRGQKTAEKLFEGALLLHLFCSVPAVTSPYLAGTLAFGFLMNLLCGIIAGYYLFVMTRFVEEKKRAAVFGIGYALSILASWLLSATAAHFYYSDKILLVLLVLTVFIFLVVLKMKTDPENTENVQTETPDRKISRRTLYLCALLVLIFSVVSNSGFAFPAADLRGSVNVELSRLVYAAGLIIAGFAADRDRKYAAVCALAALMIPFITISLRGETLPAIIFWVINYFTFGFYAVYRVILFSDIAGRHKLYGLAGAGLMIGRVGDAVGEAICIALSGHLTVLVILTAVLFAAAVVVFLQVFQILYIPQAERQMSEREKFYRFSAQHDLSVRERDMLRLILEDKTVAEIADALSISENTVKYHIKNILQKTGYKTRKDLIAAYLGTIMD